MSTFSMVNHSERRVSKRRKIKTQKVIDEYQILNPYKRSNRKTIIPDELNKQLRKLEFLSKTNLDQIRLRKSRDEENENTLSRMRKASTQQQEKYKECLDCYNSGKLAELSLCDSKNNTFKGLQGRHIEQPKPARDRLSCIRTNAEESLSDLLGKGDDFDENFLHHSKAAHPETHLQNPEYHDAKNQYDCRQMDNDLEEDDIFADNYKKGYLPSIEHEHEHMENDHFMDVELAQHQNDQQIQENQESAIREEHEKIQSNEEMELLLF